MCADQTAEAEGLAIVKHIAQLHGAVLEVESEVGKGSAFHVRFPAVA